VTPLAAQIRLEAVDQCRGGRQVQYRLGDEGPRQGHPLLRRTPDEPTAGRDEAIYLCELQYPDHLLQRRTQRQVVLLLQKGK
jgi:hypothetical protein